MNTPYKNLNEEVKKILDDDIPKIFKEKIDLELDYINKQYGTNYSTSYDLMRLGDALFTVGIHHKLLPNNMSQKRADSLILLSNQLYLYSFSLPAKNCFKSKDLIEEVMQHLDHKVNNETKIKYMLFSLHDSNISPMLAFLGHNLTKKPKYNANIRFELLKSGEKFFVRTKFDQKTIKICKDELCSFDEFKQLISENITKQCSDFTINQDYLQSIGVD